MGENLTRLFIALFVAGVVSVTLADFARMKFNNPDATPVTMVLWPEGKMPDVQTAQRVPEMIVTLPERRTTDAILIVAPGGSYEKLCTWEDERAALFSRRGMATVQLRYRVPRPVGAPKHQTAWQDAQRAVRLVRAHAVGKSIPRRSAFWGILRADISR